ncbi:MAG TPA: NAD(P)/FAD-dependent oxidoreductase [Humisphaera sp.]|jgi:hypothetical protein|nr:NAD(P)/FAD-dependent oxidoreductase [Humisphaera sp.]
MPQTDIAIIGGGAAGLAAAIFAAQAAGPSRRIIILDRAKSLGAKILVSGGGRCNVTHDIVRPEDFNGRRTIVRNILAAFDAAATVKWFESLGVELKREPTGKLFPVTDSARTVLQSLLRRCDALKIEIHTGEDVKSAAHATEGASPFAVKTNADTWTTSRIILATGGRSLPRSGSDGSGWQLAAALGHTVTPTFAALVPLVLAPSMFHASLAGISQEVELSVFDDGKRIDRRAGSLLWTHFGISGPVVMDASRHWVIARESGGKPEMRCNLLHPDSFDLIERWLIEQATAIPRTTIINALARRLPERVAGAILGHCEINATTPCGQITRDNRRALAHALTALPLAVQQHRGWNYAEVTAGGVPLDEIDFRTMESRKVPGLYLAGEILDCDGRIGGFNFQWAWATGYLAGKAAGDFASAS